MYPNGVYIGLNLALFRYFGANVYAIWVHGPLLGKQNLDNAIVRFMQTCKLIRDYPKQLLKDPRRKPTNPLSNPKP